MIHVLFVSITICFVFGNITICFDFFVCHLFTFTFAGFEKHRTFTVSQ